MEKIVSPETIFEHIVAYTIWAGDVISEIFSDNLKDTSRYSLALIPYWPPFYTAILQSAGCLSVNKKAKTAIVVYHQSKEAESIMVSNHDIGPLLGKTMKFPKELSIIFTKFKFTKPLTTIDINIENQIYIIRTLTTSDNMLLVGIWSKVSESDVIKLTKFIRSKVKDHNMFLVSNLSYQKEFKSGRKQDEKLIMNIIKSKPTTKKDFSMPKLFSQISIDDKKVPEVVAYSNSWDFGWKRDKTNWYACIIA